MKSKEFSLCIAAENADQLKEGNWSCVNISDAVTADKVHGDWVFTIDGEELTPEQMKNKLYTNFTSIAASQYLKNN